MKKFIAVFLAVIIMLSSVAVIASAAGTDPAAVIPHLNIHGFMCCPLYADKNDPDSGKIWEPDTGTIVSNVLALFPPLFRFIIDGNSE